MVIYLTHNTVTKLKDSDCPDVYKEVEAITTRGKRREADILPLLRVGQIKKD